MTHIAPPSNFLPVTVAQDTVLVKKPDLVLHVSLMRAYPGLFGFVLSLRTDRGGDWADPFAFGYMPPAGACEMWGVFTADGHVHRYPVSRGAAGGDGRGALDYELFLPLPRDATSAGIGYVWPAEGLPESTVALDLAGLRRAAGRSRPCPAPVDDRGP